MNSVEKQIAITLTELALLKRNTKFVIPFDLLRLGSTLREDQSDLLLKSLDKLRDSEAQIETWKLEDKNLQIELPEDFPLPDVSETEIDIVYDKFIRRVLIYRLYQEYRSIGQLYTHYPLVNLAPLLEVDKKEIFRHVKFLENEYYLEYKFADGGRCTSDLTNAGLKLCENRFDLFSEFSAIKVHEKEAKPELEPVSDAKYVAESRIEELKNLTSKNYDLTKLIQLCNELNIAYQFDCKLSIAMILRAIIDHVPPIFNVSNFAQVASNYPGGRSFKDLMARLEMSLRKIADTHLHSHIKRKETLPTFTQVNFSAELDVLLAEIIRIIS